MATRIQNEANFILLTDISTYKKIKIYQTLMN